MDYEKILVLDKGRVEEFGAPVDLINARNTTGTFRQMCLESGEFDDLLKIAETKIMTH
jgi:ABC-type multidrug transport system fused ATPase/permease subunit